MKTPNTRTIVQEIYDNNIKITDVQLAEEILKYPELTPLDLWLLPQYPFNIWRRKYDYPRLLESIKRRRKDFIDWMNDQGITDDYLLNGYFSDFFNYKPLSPDKQKHLVKVTWEGKTELQSWDNYKKSYEEEGDGSVQYEYIKAYISYYDWILIRTKTRFNFMNQLDRYEPNTDEEYVYVNIDFRMLKMGAMEPPTNALGVMLRGKTLEFVNASGLSLNGHIRFGDMGNLEFSHSAVDNLKCNELLMYPLKFENCSIRNIQVKNSDITSWLFVNSIVSGNIIDSKLSRFRIFGGKFNPIFANSEIDFWEVVHKDVEHESDFEKTYRTLSKAAYDSGNKELAADYKMKNLNLYETVKKELRSV